MISLIRLMSCSLLQIGNFHRLNKFMNNLGDSSMHHFQRVKLFNNLVHLRCIEVKNWNQNHRYTCISDTYSFKNQTAAFLLHYHISQSNYKVREMESNQVLDLYEINESSPPHSEIVVIIARGVGLLVAIVAVISSITMMMLLRYFVAVWLSSWGIVGVCSTILLVIYSIMKINGVPLQLLWTIFSRSCNQNARGSIYQD